MKRLFLLIILFCPYLNALTQGQMEAMARKAAIVKKTHGKIQRRNIKFKYFRFKKVILGNPGHSRYCTRHMQTFYPNSTIYVPR